MTKVSIPLPLNEHQITYTTSGVNIGLWGKGKYVPTFQPDGACLDKNCKYPEEHLTFDGQIFYQQPIKKGDKQ